MSRFPPILLSLVLCACPAPPSQRPSTPPASPPTELPPTEPPLQEPIAFPVFAPGQGVVHSAGVAAVEGVLVFAVEHAALPSDVSTVEIVRVGGAKHTVEHLSDRLAPGLAHLPIVLAHQGRVDVLTRQTTDQDIPVIEAWADVGSASSPLPIRPVPTPYRMGRMQMARDHDGWVHVCWRGQTGDEEDVFGVSAPDLEGLPNARDQPLATEPGIVEDHCDLGFDTAGNRYVAYHRRGVASQVALRFDRPDGVSGSMVLPVPAQVTDVDFPALAADEVGVSVVAVPTESGVLVAWSCTADCTDPDAWMASIVDPGPGRQEQPRMFAVRGHRFLFYETHTANGTQVEWSYACAGDAWAHAGPVAPDEPVTRITNVVAGTARSIAHDPSTDQLHMAFVRGEPEDMGAMGFSVSIGAVCASSNL